MFQVKGKEKPQMKYRCRHCGRTFPKKCAHICDTGLRKRDQDWEIAELTYFEYMNFTSMKEILDGELIGMFGGQTTLRAVSDELGCAIRNYGKGKGNEV